MDPQCEMALYGIIQRQDLGLRETKAELGGLTL